MNDQEYVAAPVLCLSCGFSEEHPVLGGGGGLPKVAMCKCPQCSNNAYVLHPLRLRHVIGAMGKEIVRLKMDMIDVQGALDDD